MSGARELLREDALLDSPQARAKRETVTGRVIEDTNELGLTAGRWL
jgi:hypothetical protein